MDIKPNKRDFNANKLKIGTRGSPLALAQALEVKREITNHHKLHDKSIEIITISTKGDRILDRPLTEIGGKGLFTEEIEEKLYNHEIDIAVHSMKDLPPQLPKEFVIAAVLERHDASDAVSYTHLTLPTNREV